MIDFPPDIAARMKQGAIELCQIQFINIELVRKQSGAQWHTLKKKIFDIGAFFIEKRVNGQDVVLRCADGFIVIFADANPPPPVERAQSLSIEMNQFFIGEDAFRALSVRCNHMKLEPRELAAFLAGQGAEIEDKPDARPPVPAKPHPIELDPLANAEVIFEPVWDRRREVVTTNMALARGVHPHTGNALRGRDLCHGDNRRQSNARYDCRVLDGTIAELEAMRAAKRPSAFSVPIHLQTICRRETRMEYFERLQNLPEPDRRLLFFYIDGIETGTPISQIEDAFGTLRQLGGGVMAVLGFGNADLTPFRDVDLRLVGWACPNGRADLSPSQFEGVKRLARLAEERRIQTFMTQVSTPRMFEQCLEAEIAFLTGSVIGGSLTGASSPHVLSQQDILPETDDVYEI
ncbi:hypothetical protein [Hyphobacterium sp.]|uniref:hypothetical protein n=1 Tax=Hyphobacterium sp. TaxID=2004662 RepID=UPI003B5166F7